MLRELFPSLGRRDSMLFLTSIFFSGQGALDLWELLPDEVAERMQEHAGAVLELPKEKRLKMLVRDMKRMMAMRSNSRLEGVDPSWITAGFKGEKPRVIAMVLMHMPSSISRQIVQRLPDQVRNALPQRSELRDVPMEIVRLVRSQFDAKFAAMEMPKQITTFGFREIVALEARELIGLTRALGVEELACAFVSVGKRALAELLRRMPRANAEELIIAVKKVSRRDALELKAAQKLLARVLVNFQNTDELFQKAGLYALAKAITLEPRDFVRQVCQRFPRAHGRLLEEYLAKAKEFGDWDRERTNRLQDRILDHVAELSARGKISPHYRGFEFQYHNQGEDEDE